MNGGFRWGDVGVIGALIVNIIIGTWEIAQLDGRQNATERELVKDELQIAELNKSDIEKSQHLVKVDDAVDNIKSNIETILQSVERIENNTGPGDTNSQPNFIRRK